MSEGVVGAKALGERIYHGLEIEIAEDDIQSRATEEIDVTFPNGEIVPLKHIRPRDQRFEVIYFDDLIGNAKFSLERVEIGRFRLMIPEQWRQEMPEWAGP